MKFIGHVATIYLYVLFKRHCENPVISWVLVIFFTRNFMKKLVFTMIEYLNLILEFFWLWDSSLWYTQHNNIQNTTQVQNPQKKVWCTLVYLRVSHFTSVGHFTLGSSSARDFVLTRLLEEMDRLVTKSMILLYKSHHFTKLGIASHSLFYKIHASMAYLFLKAL